MATKEWLADWEQSEEKRRQDWRLRVLVEAGYPILLAEQMAVRPSVGEGAVDIHRAVELAAAGCRPETAAMILL